MKYWTRVLPWSWRLMIKFFILHAFPQYLCQVSLSAPVSSPENGQSWLRCTHAPTDCDYTRPISMDQLDKSTPLFPTQICLSSTYQPTYQFIVVAQFLGLRERAGRLWHCPTTREFMEQCLPNLAPPATASSCSFQNKPLSHKVAFISFPGRRVGWTPPDGPKEMKTSRVRMCAPKPPHGGQRLSRRLSAGLLAKGSATQTPSPWNRIHGLRRKGCLK